MWTIFLIYSNMRNVNAAFWESVPSNKFLHLCTFFLDLHEVYSSKSWSPVVVQYIWKHTNEPNGCTKVLHYNNYDQSHTHWPKELPQAKMFNKPLLIVVLYKCSKCSYLLKTSKNMSNSLKRWLLAFFQFNMYICINIWAFYFRIQVRATELLLTCF